jgi:chromosome segregation ATPase
VPGGCRQGNLFTQRLQEGEAMNTRCLCAEQRASESAAHIDRLNARVDALRRQWREQMDISDTARVQVGELRRLLDQERESKLAMVAALDESMAREEAMRAAFDEAQSIVKRLDGGLEQACSANDSLVSQLRDRDRQIAELRSRLVENAEQARADRIGWAA